MAAKCDKRKGGCARRRKTRLIARFILNRHIHHIRIMNDIYIGIGIIIFSCHHAKSHIRFLVGPPIGLHVFSCKYPGTIHNGHDFNLIKQYVNLRRMLSFQTKAPFRIVRSVAGCLVLDSQWKYQHRLHQILRYKHL